MTYPIGSREPRRLLLVACARDPRIISTLSPGSRANIRKELGIGPRPSRRQAGQLGEARRSSPRDVSPETSLLAATLSADNSATRQTPRPHRRTEPVVVNRHHYKGRRLPDPWLYIGRNDRDPSKASPLRNPFDVRRYGKKALCMYRDHLRAMVEDEEPAIMASLRSITPLHHLVCSCAPRPCHGSVVVEVWRALHSRP